MPSGWLRTLGWIAATALAVGGGLLSLAWQTSAGWWIGLACTLPLFGLFARTQLRSGDQGPPSGGFTDGPWGAP
jgi:hypothetical protein